MLDEYAVRNTLVPPIIIMMQDYQIGGSFMRWACIVEDGNPQFLRLVFRTHTECPEDICCKCQT